MKILHSYNKMIILVLTLIAHGSKCRTLAFEGGGTKGGFEAGAISAIVNNTATIDHAYDFVSGVSTGALNTNGFTIYPKGRE